MKTKLLLLFMLFTSMAMAQNYAKIDELFAPYAGENPGAALAIVKDGKIVYSQSYGLSELESKTKVNLNTNFRLASVSKQFTAAAILQLIGKGKLNLQTTLSDCFPELPAYAKGISIQQLLNHTSGILDYDDVIDETIGGAQLADQDVVRACKAFTKTYFEPGSRYRYSNTAYVLLGLIIEKYSGEHYPAYLSKHLFRPLKMNGSIAYVKDVNTVKDRAYGYAEASGGWIRKDQSSTSATLGDGGIYSNINDLFKWEQALYTDQILPRSTWELAFAHQKLNNGAEIDYGFGWHLKKEDTGMPVVYHTGSTTSFRNVIYRIPSDHFSIIILTNRNTPKEMDMVKMAENVRRAYLN
ncbi:MAG: serine hydrolase domain-containing protein [Pedobacter sp.]|nr:serine hydrolase domain-containing protein [Pedobacter sp.]MDQ8054283.1 serine hydrolase domain-containing protein [Pedobacter sp.]